MRTYGLFRRFEGQPLKERATLPKLIGLLQEAEAKARAEGLVE